MVVKKLRFIYYYLIFRLFMGNPLLALFILFIIYAIVDRKFIGLMPDFFKPLKRKKRIKDLEENIKLNPSNTESYRELGYLYLEDKKYQKAINNFRKALDKMSQYAEIHLHLGKANYLLGNKDEGIEELLKALEISPKAGYGEPYIYLLDYEINKKKPSREIINQFIKNLHTYGTVENLYKGGRVLKSYDNVQANELLLDALETYKVSPKYLKKSNRRWAFLAKINQR